MLERIQNILNNVEKVYNFEWEQKITKHIQFLKDMIKHHEVKGASMSTGQKNYMEYLEHRYRDEHIQEEKQWCESYGDDLRDIAVKCAHYYAAQTPAYYHNTVKKVLAAPGTHILTKREFHKMCMNKYADKVLQEYKTDPKYKVGDLVTARASSLHKHKGHGLILAANYEPITRACKGSKPYQVKFIKSNCIERVYEKEIKSIKRKK